MSIISYYFSPFYTIPTTTLPNGLINFHELVNHRILAREYRSSSLVPFAMHVSFSSHQKRISKQKAPTPQSAPPPQVSLSVPPSVRVRLSDYERRSARPFPHSPSAVIIAPGGRGGEGGGREAESRGARARALPRRNHRPLAPQVVARSLNACSAESVSKWGSEPKDIAEQIVNRTEF